jgi:aminopeptidase YwaD
LYFNRVSRFLAALLVAAAFSQLRSEERTVHLPPLDRVLPPRAEAIYHAVSPRVNARVAMETVAFMSPLWRLAGNPGYNQSIDFIAARLRNGGFAADADIATVRVEAFENSGQGWEQHRGTLAMETASGREIVLSREQDLVPLCINSFSTPAGGRSLLLVDVGAGTAPADYEGKDVKGALVLGSGPVGPLFNRAVRERGAAGVVSSNVARYTRPDDTPNVLQWGSIPYDESLRSFAFKATPRAAKRLREALAGGPVRVHVDIVTTFHRGENRTLIAELAGTTRRSERVVLVAHVQEPGANDNASGSGTLLAAALALRDLIASGAAPRPARTLTFMWLDEIRGSERWIKDHPQDAASVVAMMSLDMTGQDTSKTGGTFLIEKGPDPSAIYPRPSDPHSEWGAGEVPRELVRGHFLNDLHLAVCLRRARDTGWVVRTNPYEGGSDHTVFTRNGVAALLNWHFTDRYYHTNLDTVDKVSATEMGHVATAVATTAMFLASAVEQDQPALVKLVDEAARARAETERANQASDEILGAWKKWYAEARASVTKFVGPTVARALMPPPARTSR